MSSLTAIGRWMGSPLIRFRVAVLWAQSALVLLAFALPLSSVHWLRRPLPLPGSIAVFVSDLVVVLAVALWPVARLASGRQAGKGLRTPVLGVPFAVFALALLPGLVRGHERYDVSFVGQPLRLVLYAGIAFAMVSLSARETYKALVVVLYAGTVWQAALGTFSLATGRHQTGSYVLSTGGTRVLALSASLFIAGTLLLALVNVELDSAVRRRWVHVAMIPVAAYGVALSYGRTTIAALVVTVPLLVLQLNGLRRSLRRHWWAPALAIVALAAASPLLGSTLVDRLTSNPLHDQTVRWRTAAVKASLAGMWSGDWKTVSPIDPTLERLRNGGFEEGTAGWDVQGGSISTVPSPDPSFGKRSLRLVTNGDQTSEGPYSSPVLTAFGQSWTFSIWLKGQAGGELVNVGIWSYGEGRSPIVQANLPVTLTTTPTRYVVSTVITDRRTTSIRALVRTRENPQAITALGDRASLKSVRALTGPRDVASQSLPAGGWVQQVLGGDGKPHDVGGAPAILAGRNYLMNGGFENGTLGWLYEGATASTIESNNPAFGTASLELATLGRAGHEGLGSASVAAHRGQTWLFAIWLKGFSENERVNVSIRQYDRHERIVAQSVAPFTLSPLPAQYYLASTVNNRETTHVRAFVQTQAAPQAIKLDADSALLGVQAPKKPSGKRLGAAAPSAPPASNGAHGGLRDAEPLIGLGFGREIDYLWGGNVYHLHGDPHNSFVWLLGGGGVLALGAFLFLLAAFARDAWLRARRSEGVERALVLWALAMCLVLMINALAEPLLSDPPILLAVCVVMLLPALVKRAAPLEEGDA